MTNPAITKTVSAACRLGLEQYAQHRSMARGFLSARQSAGEPQSLAMAGFASQVSLDLWTASTTAQFEALRELEFTPDVLEFHGSDGPAYVRFGYVGLGILLGLQQLGAIQDDDDRFLARTALAGFMMMHAQAIYEAAAAPV